MTTTAVQQADNRVRARLERAGMAALAEIPLAEMPDDFAHKNSLMFAGMDVHAEEVESWLEARAENYLELIGEDANADMPTVVLLLAGLTSMGHWATLFGWELAQTQTQAEPGESH